MRPNDTQRKLQIQKTLNLVLIDDLDKANGKVDKLLRENRKLRGKNSYLIDQMTQMRYSNA